MPPPAVAKLDAAARDCARLIEQADVAIARARVSDAMSSRIAGFPYLRVNRFLASYRLEPMDEARYSDWGDRMASLATEAYTAELANLPATQRAALLALAGEAPLPEALAGCVARLREADLSDPSRQQALRRAARVPDDYADWKRVLGLYYLTRIPFSAGVNRNQQHMQALFDRPLDAFQVNRIRYQPVAAALSQDQLIRVLRRARRGALEIPDPQGEDLKALFETFAPVVEIDQISSDDAIGALIRFGRFTTVDVDQPQIYTQLSHTRVQGRVLLQLNYVAWFSARPKRGVLDTLGGHLDGLTWRVTLDEDGRPLLFDSMHNCGCYHLFVLTPRVRPRPSAAVWDDPLLVAQTLGDAWAGERLTLRAEAGSHYLYRVLQNDRGAAAVRNYELRPYLDLRSLPGADGTIGAVFDEQGLIRGSERLERYLFWPMGIAEPGAMRIMGRHAIAFVGRRHFDDSDLLEKNFIFAPP
jgi:hypothetical protein